MTLFFAILVLSIPGPDYSYLFDPNAPARGGGSDVDLNCIRYRISGQMDMFDDYDRDSTSKSRSQVTLIQSLKKPTIAVLELHNINESLYLEV